MYLKFVDDLIPYKGKISKSFGNVVQVILEEEITPNASGFRVYHDYEMTKLLGNYLDYTTIYDAENFMLSNDGSVKKVVEELEETTEDESTEESNGNQIDYSMLETRVSDLEEAIMELSTIMLSESEV